MMNSTFAISTLQGHFKNTLETREKEVELAVLHVEQCRQIREGSGQDTRLAQKKSRMLPETFRR